ncbi:diacylglycerol kinase family lipid kinase [Rhizobium sp. SIMBA_035]|jgi:YegS/Rv2252/BmrU family lipid kinase
MKIGIVLNPASGRRGRRVFWSALRRALEARSADISLRETKGFGDAGRHGRELAEDGCDLVLAVGGDGTVGEVAGGILRSRRPGAVFSFIPTGTGCDFARNFAIPREPSKIAEHLLTAPVRSVDAGLLTCENEDGVSCTRHFINIASFGVSGKIVSAVNEARRGRRLPGPMVFFYHSLMQILRYKPCKIRLRLDGEDVYDGPITAVAVANGAWFGGGMKVAPGADVSDGLFDVVIIRGAARLRVLTLMNSIYSGKHVKSPLVSIHRARLVEVWPAGEAAPVDSDGEAPGHIPARFEILPGAVNLLV